MLRITSVAGRATDPEIAERLHDFAHAGRLETVTLSRSDMSRRRQQVRSDRGTELALILDRDAVLETGSVLLLADDHAIVVALDEPEWLVIRSDDAARAFELGYFAGNMHWKVKFEGRALCISLEGDRADYLARLGHLLGKDAVVVEARVQPEHSHPHAHG